MIPAVALTLSVVAVTWVVWIDGHDGRRLDELSEALDLAVKELDRAVLRVSYLEDAARTPGIEEREALQGPFPQVNPEEPITRPQPIVRGVPTNTTPQAAVIDAGLAAITAEVAHYGRHAAKAGR